MPERFTQREVSRIVGVDAARLRYWQRLRLVVPSTRWGERFYNFGDLVALRSIKSITESRIPARKICRAVAALELRGEKIHAPLGALQFFSSGRQVAAIAPGSSGQAIEPLTGQFVLPFHGAAAGAEKVRQMHSGAAEQIFEYAVCCEAHPDGAEEAMRLYRRVIDMQPLWSEPHINLGCVFYKAGELEKARLEFCAALEIEPESVVGHFNLGCVLDEMGSSEKAIEHLRRATELDPAHADAHFNLASTYEKSGHKKLALQHWISYLQLQSRGPWADFARTQIKKSEAPKTPLAPIPFRPPNRN
ncbi:MAG TPA: tetratricopeptide repeat protein [Candidatus Acidoferrales bacterium]|nr:tetratricopeptide repeat protein [Candidatus Acidoferrales bacterium]